MSASKVTASKRCDHEESRWARCDCEWRIYFRAFNKVYQFSLDKELNGCHAWMTIDRKLENGCHVWSKADAEAWGHIIRDMELKGMWVWTKDRKPGALRSAPVVGTARVPEFDTFGKIDRDLLKRVVLADRGLTAEWKADVKCIHRQIRLWVVEGERVEIVRRKRGQVKDEDNEPDLAGTLGGCAASLITEPLLEDLFQDYLEERSISRQNKFVIELNRTIEWGVRRGYIDTPLTGDSKILAGRTAVRRHVRVRAPLDEWLITAALLRVPLRNGIPITPVAPPDPGPYEVTPKLYAGNRLAAIIRTAIETGCRRGELLGMKWEHVFADAETPYILVPGNVGGDPRARKSQPRYIRLTAALALVLAQLRYDANGEPFPMWKYIFGDERGDKVTDVGKAWETCVLHAHGISPRWLNGALDPVSRAALREIDLHFHDLRHEAGHRWIEEGVPANTIQNAYGHENLETTSIYLGIPLKDVPQAFDKYEQTRALPPKVELVEFGRNVDKTCTRDAFQVLIEANKQKQNDGKIRIIK